jgi:hypothetical protein
VGKAPETGIEDMQSWVSRASPSATLPTICTASGPGLLSGPTWTSTSPKKNPDEPMSETSLVLEWIELSTAIGQPAVAARRVPGRGRAAAGRLAANPSACAVGGPNAPDA